MAAAKKTPKRGEKIDFKYWPEGTYKELVPDPWGLGFGAKPSYIP